RKQLGRQLKAQILRAIGNDVEHTVFSYIPNTAETAFQGMVEGIKEEFPMVRTEKIVSKDIKLRTFITEGNSRNDLAAHVYDITYGTVEAGVDNLVVIDDSIVRGTTLRESIIKILDRLHPKKIVIVSSAPQIRYPDYYGIDMSRLGEFIAFQACIALLKERGMEQILDDVYNDCKALLESEDLGIDDIPVRHLYEPFTTEELNAKMVEILRPEGVTTPIEIVYQSIEGLHQASPNHPGDWYFTGHYPTPGGVRMVLQTYVKWYQGR
ncbi:MAG: amidophosphoribosyltransferase, partial [Prevotellaceae bacterium]|nr:amidophosphoribosyltransferase [Prevotellaceae bacterium]